MAFYRLQIPGRYWGIDYKFRLIIISNPHQKLDWGLVERPITAGIQRIDYRFRL
jgi:hypothetical protein